jgi:RHS repeat-associated protein
VGGATTAAFAYNGDGNCVKTTFGSGDAAAITAHAGSRYEQTTRYQESFADGLAQGWTAASGTWAVNGGGYRQSGTGSNTNAYLAFEQAAALNYEWTAGYTSGTSAGLYLFASAGTGTERGNSYRIWQDATTVKIYENANNVATLRASFAAVNAAGQTHSYKVSYDPLIGRFDLWRDGGSLGTWTDTSAVKRGGFVSLRTDGANVLFDNLTFTRESKYYYAGGQRVAVRHNASTAVHYLLTDHLGSTALTLDQNGARYNTNTELRYYPYGVARYTAGTTPTSFNFTGQRKDSGSGLLFYNARWYDPVVGRFLQADTLVPSPGDPQSLNRYSYTLNNSLRYTDSTGHCAEEDKACIGRLREIQAEFGVEIDDGEQLFTLDALNAIATGMGALRQLMGEKNFAEVVAGTKYRVYHGGDGKGYNGVAHDGKGTILVGDLVLSNQGYLTRFTPHELAHVWDWKCDDCMSRGMQLATGSSYNMKKAYAPKGEPPTDYAGDHNAGEDWAESVTATVDVTYVPNWRLDPRQGYVVWALTVAIPPQDAFRRWAR